MSLIPKNQRMTQPVAPQSPRRRQSGGFRTGLVVRTEFVYRHGVSPLVNERQETIEGAGVITDLLRFRDDPVRRRFDRRALSDVVREARAFRSLMLRARMSGEEGTSPLSASWRRRSGAIRMSSCRLSIYPTRFPGLLSENNPQLSPYRVRPVAGQQKPGRAGLLPGGDGDGTLGSGDPDA